MSANCKPDRREYFRKYNVEWRKRNKEHRRQYKKQYEQTHTLQCKKMRSLWRKKTAPRIKELKHQSYLRNREKILKSCKERYLQNIEKIRQRSAQYYKNHSEHIRKRVQEYKLKNVEKVRAAQKISGKNWRSKNVEHCRINAQIWRTKNREHFNAVALNRIRTRPECKIRSIMRCRIRGALQRKNITKSHKTEELIGCSIAFLKNHLESQFQPGMSWENYNRHGWNVDHIIPCDAFDLTKETEQKKCFNYRNLQPLWSIENIRKRDTLPANHVEHRKMLDEVVVL